MLICIHNKIVTFAWSRHQSVNQHRSNMIAITRDNQQTMIFNLQLSWTNVTETIHESKTIPLTSLNTENF